MPSKNPQYGIHFRWRNGDKPCKWLPRRRKSRADVVSVLAGLVNDEAFRLTKITYGREELSPEHKQLFLDYAKYIAAHPDAHQ